MKVVKIYTDGSCNAKFKVGAWAAIIFYNNEKILLKGVEENTNHNRMELKAVIEAVKHIQSISNTGHNVEIYSDSQYVVNIPERINKFIENDFLTKKGVAIRNIEMVKELISLINSVNIKFVKVKAHLKKTDIENPNREVDKLSRKLVRETLKGKTRYIQ